MFLAVRTKKVIDVGFQAAVLDEDGDEVTPEVAEEAHLEVSHTYVEDAAAQVAINVANGVDITYYKINFDGNLVPSLSKVSEKKTTKKPPPQKLVKIQDEAGTELGEAVV